MTQHFPPRWNEIKQKNEREEKEKCVSTMKTAHEYTQQNGSKEWQQPNTHQQTNGPTTRGLPT